MSEHAVYAPSSADIWINCPGMPDYVRSLGIKSSGHTLYTARGSVIHAMGEQRLLNPYVPLDEDVRWDFWCDGLPDHLAEEIITDHMVAQAVQYVEAVNDLCVPGDELYVEYRSRHSDVLFGTADAVIVQDNSIIIADLKTGNHLVDPKENLQLLTYAMMSIDNLDLTPDKVTQVIIQPPNTRKPVRVWETGMDRIQSHAQVVEDALASNELNPGTHCKWCQAKNLCTAGTQVLDGLDTPSFFGKSGASLF